MREKIRDNGRIFHIKKAIANIEKFLINKEESDLDNESILFFSIVKNLEIIGEAIYMLSLDFKNSHTQFNWEDYAKLRHVLVHGYYTLNYKIIFEICKQDIPNLKQYISSLSC